MKILAVLFFVIGMTSLRAAENYNGQFELLNSKYALRFSYSLVKNQVAVEKQIRFFDETTFPETNETIPAYCYFDLKFPFTYSLEITDLNTQKVVYTKNGQDLLNANAFGGFVQEGKCSWEIADWKKELSSTMLRVSDQNFVIKNQAYRFTLDTHLSISSLGVLPNDVIATDSVPQKNTDGLAGGEVWLDTMPDQKGDYQRTYFRLYN